MQQSADGILNLNLIGCIVTKKLSYATKHNDHSFSFLIRRFMNNDTWIINHKLILAAVCLFLPE